MNTVNSNPAIPIRSLRAQGYPGSTAHHYREIAAGRLVATKLGSRTVVLKDDADRWVASLPKIEPAKHAA